MGRTCELVWDQHSGSPEWFLRTEVFFTLMVLHITVLSCLPVNTVINKPKKFLILLWTDTGVYVCVLDKVWKLRSDKALENPRLERKRGEQARHWASTLEHHADQGSQRDSRSHLKGLRWAKCFSAFMHGNKMLAATVSVAFYHLFVLWSLLNSVVCHPVTKNSHIFIT